jgi:hypothetical protein
MQIESQVDIGGAVYKQRLDHHTRVISEFEDILSSIKNGSGEEASGREHKKNKLTARERISNVIDENSQFLELSSFAAYKVYEDEVPAAGIITGVGKVSGRLCMIVANAQTVKENLSIKTFNQYPNLDIYDGEWKHGKKSGAGTYKSNIGVTYIGSFKDNLTPIRYKGLTRVLSNCSKEFIDASNAFFDIVVLTSRAPVLR